MPETRHQEGLRVCCGASRSPYQGSRWYSCAVAYVLRFESDVTFNTIRRCDGKNTSGVVVYKILSDINSDCDDEREASVRGSFPTGFAARAARREMPSEAMVVGGGGGVRFAFVPFVAFAKDAAREATSAAVTLGPTAAQSSRDSSSTKSRTNFHVVEFVSINPLSA